MWSILLQGYENGTKPFDYKIDAIDWFVKGGKPAPEGAEFAYAFAYTKEGEIREETRVLVEVIQRDGQIKVGDFIFRLGGRDKKLLNRVKAN